MKARSANSRLTAATILDEQAPRPWWNTNYTWGNDDIEKLKILAEANADLNRSAAALGRSPAALCWKCRDIGIAMSKAWAQFLRRER